MSVINPPKCALKINSSFENQQYAYERVGLQATRNVHHEAKNLTTLFRSIRLRPTSIILMEPEMIIYHLEAWMLIGSFWICYFIAHVQFAKLFSVQIGLRWADDVMNLLKVQKIGSLAAVPC